MLRAREDIDVSEEPPRKKQRTTVASNACTNCRSRHIKCTYEKISLIQIYDGTLVAKATTRIKI
jgi:transposase